MPTKKTKGRDVPLSEFLASGPRRDVFSGMMEECSSVTCEMIDWCTSELMVSLPCSGEREFSPLLFPSSDDEGLGFDQFHVEEYRSE